jgi:DNA-binding NtrC family response regulator
MDKRRGSGFSPEECEIVRVFSRRIARPLGRAAETTLVRRAPAQIAGTSAFLERLRAHVDEAALSSLPVLVLGEPGSGKDLVARAIHTHGPSRDRPFAALPGTSVTDLETGISRAGIGTLVLDNVESLSPDAQEILEGRLRAGALAARPVALCSKDLRKAVETGAFRRELFDRLGATVIVLVPLRERTEDIAPLAEHFLAEVARETGSPRRAIAQEAMDALCRHGWPGNVRELREVIRRSALAGHGMIHAEDLPGYITGQSTVKIRAGDSYGERLERAEREFITRVLSDHGNRLRSAAKALGLDRETLRRRMERLGLPAADDDDVVEI